MRTGTVAGRTAWLCIALGLGVAVAACSSGEDAIFVPTTTNTGGGGGGDVACGNGFVENVEECDDGNLSSGDGCDNNCYFTCIAGDPERDLCDDDNPCNGVETCAPEHTCTPGTALGEGDECGAALICVGGNCVAESCGDGIASSTEECDDGNATSGDGCESGCTWSCLSSDPTRDCSSANPCMGDGTCDDGTHECAAGLPLADGTSCGSGQLCVSGACVLEQCGDGFVSGLEQCDFGPGENVAGSGCEPTCAFSCTQSPNSCDDADPCNGDETCDAVLGPNNGAGQRCTAGTSLPDDTVCGVGRYCNAGVCTQSQCGDGNLEPGETCDDGNPANGDGCDNDCTYSCATPAVDCTASPPACRLWQCSVAHVCESAADPSQNGNACPGGPGYTCNNGVCSAPSAVCGNGVLETGEACDLGAANGTGQGCTATCQLDCTTAADCTDGDLCNGSETCVPATVGGQAVMQCQPGTAAADGTSCGATAICLGGLCLNSICGDGWVDGALGEACDLGALNGTGQGCSATCQLDCTTDGDCSDAAVCNGVESCVPVTVNGQLVQRCEAGSPAAVCTACAGGLCNGGGQCVASTCGDGCVGAGESCDPPNGTTCSATCQLAAVCGNGVLEAGEQCDDGDLYNLDGCDSGCKYEVVTRMTSLAIQSTLAPAGCTPTTNRLGRQSLTSTALNSMNQSLTDGINAGTTNILTQLLGLDDLTGVADPNGLSIGVVSSILDPARGAWPGTNPIDWWFLVDHNSVDAFGLPTDLLTNGTLAARQLVAGPSDVSLVLLLGGSPANLRMRSARIAATLNGTPAPNVPAPPPAQLAAGLTVFQTLTASGAGQGLCGNITVESLAQIPLPEDLAQGGATPCGACANSRQYTYCGANMPVGPGCNSLLDALVGGCRVVACFITAINPQQPDVNGTDSDIDTLTLGAGNKVPQSQLTGNDDAYSSYMRFDGNRAHLTGQTCGATPDCQSGQTCVSGSCQ